MWTAHIERYSRFCITVLESSRSYQGGGGGGGGGWGGGRGYAPPAPSPSSAPEIEYSVRGVWTLSIQNPFLESKKREDRFGVKNPDSELDVVSV